MDLKKVLDQTVRELKREVNKKVLKVPEIEIKVCEATSNEPWGPHGTIMGDIAQATRNLQEYHLIMGVLWKRLHDSGKNWRHVYKSLTVMEYLIANGAERVIDELREQAYQIQALLDFQYIEPNGKDQGINVQKKAHSMLALINDRGKIRELRQKAAANRDKYRGLSSTGMTFKPSSYLSTSGSYDEEQYGGGSSLKARKNDVDGKDLEGQVQREESNREDCSCGEREHNEGCAASKGGDPNSDKGSSTDGDRSHDIDEYSQYSRAPGNRGVMAAVMRAQTNHSQSSLGRTSQRRDLFFTINPADDDGDDDDFDPRGTLKCSVPVAKDELNSQSQNALEDLFANVEFQASYPPISATASNSEFEQDYDYLQTFSQVAKPSKSVPLASNSSMKSEFQPFSQTFAADTGVINGTSFDSFNPSFSSFNESPNSSAQGVVVSNGEFHPNSNNNISVTEQLKLRPSVLGSLSKTAELFGSFNTFSTKGSEREGKNIALQQHRNPFLSSTSASTFWDDPLITSLVDLSVGPRQDQNNTPLGMHDIGRSTATSSSGVSRANSLPAGATTMSMARHMSSGIGPGRSMSDMPKSS